MMCKTKRKRSNPFGAKVRFLICFLAFFMMLSGTVYSQTGNKTTVKGVVTDALGDPLIGATVAEKGTTNATMTGVDGDYTLNVSPGGTLTVTFVGFISLDIPVNGQSTVNIVLQEDSKLLDEVVVTALGIKRDKKSLGYALQEIKGEQLTETRDNNVANALAGKVAGLQIKQSGTGVAGSSRIVLRGNNSIGGNNQPLIVVDGVPINSETSGTDDYWGNRGIDKGSGMADISPDDIETMSVLKGPAAAALYGSRAGNGVIMITTKTGANKKGIGITINSNLTFDSPMQMPKYQNVYGQGTAGEYVQNAVGSWGAKMTGQATTDLMGRNTKYSPEGNDIKDFLRTGTTWTNSAELVSTSDKNTLRLAVMNLSNQSIVPNSDFKKTSVTLRGTAKLTDKLSFDAKLTYVNQKTENRVKLAYDPDNVFLNHLMMPRSYHFSDFTGTEGYAFPKGTINPVSKKDMSGIPVAWTDNISGMALNPYWATENDLNSDRKHRFIGFGSLKYEFTEWLNIQGRYGMDYISSQYKDKLAAGPTYWYPSGDFMMSKEDSYEVNADFLITFNKNLTDKLGLVATAGGNIMYRHSEGMLGQTTGLVDPAYGFTLANGKKQAASNTAFRKQINSLYATASFAWNNMVYLDLTARNDWSSTLNPDNRSYFYPSVGASWLFTETFKNTGPLSYGKLRLSWAQVGNDTEAYQLFNYRTLTTQYVYNPVTEQIETIIQPLKSDTKSSYDLKNETINSYEIGLELKAFDNRLGLDLAYYNKEAKDQILKMNVPASTGYNYKYVNAGNVRNRGIELVLSGTPVQTKDFTWDVALNFSKNSNKIVKLADGVTQQELQHPSLTQFLKIVATEGGAYGDLLGKAYERDDNGNIKVNEKGLPIFTSEYVKLGNNNPDWMGGLSNTFRYRDFDFGFQIDMRYGGEVYMGSIKTGANYGTLDLTLDGRESMVVKGVTASGAENTVATTSQAYWAHLQDGAEPWIYDATNIRLREVSFGYKLPRKVLAKTPIHSVKLSLVARNLWMIYSKTKGFDPEAGYTSGNAQGFEMGSMPTLRSIGFNLNVAF